ncbi:MAG: chromate transporter [Oscillospiraceae bacterium]|nr:chromate transporter [Oscillospiraceae bacterium]
MPDSLKLRDYLRVFRVMFKIGLFTFGGGYAMLPQMSAEFAERCKWLKPEEITDIFAVAQSLPGVVAVNASMLTGYRLGGRKCAFVAALGSTLPSFLALIFVTLGYQAFIENRYIAGAMAGVRAAVAGTLAATVFKLGKTTLNDRWGWRLFALALPLTLLSVNPVWIILGGMAAGLARRAVTKRIK